MRRFLQLFLCATAFVLIPTFLFASHSSYENIEYQPGLADAGRGSVGRLFHPLGQLSQGRGDGDAKPSGGGGANARTTFLEECFKTAGFRWSDVKKCWDERNKHNAPSVADDLSQGAQTGPPPEEERVPGAIMGKMANATAKAELGRATWKFMHTMTLRFPEKPTTEERQKLKDFIHLFSLLYPCGECAAHFQKLIAEFPAQTGSRKSASMWLCAMHNKVNERLKKPQFDCNLLNDVYDCGCGPEPEAGGANGTAKALSAGGAAHAARHIFAS